MISRHFWDIKEDNPSFWLLFSHICQAGVPVDQFTPWRMLSCRYDIVHIHWPERHLARPSAITAFLYTLIELLLLDIARLRGAKVVWTAHNIHAHEQLHPRLESWCWRASLKRIDAFISFSHAGRDIVHETHPQTRDLPSYVIRDGHFRGAYPNHISRRQARSELQLPETASVALFLGAVRPYKNVPALARAFRELQGDDLRLVIAGRSVDAELAAEIENACGDDSRINYMNHFIPVDLVQQYMNAADLVVLPYMDILNSGSALLALSFHKPILVSGKGAMAELQQVAGSDWVRLFKPPITAQVLEEALAWARNATRPDTFAFEWGEWPYIAQRFIAAYEDVLRGPRKKNASE